MEAVSVELHAEVSVPRQQIHRWQAPESQYAVLRIKKR
jgi:hypothetical protein